MTVCGVACVNDQHAVLEASIRHLVLNGINDFFLFDHRSDPGLEGFLSTALHGLPVGIRVLRKSTEPFYQGTMIAVLTELARVEGFDIALAFDADEFWCSTVTGRSLADQIAAEMAADIDAVRVPVVNYVQHCSVDVFGEDGLATCAYSVDPCRDSARSFPELVESGTPFVAVPFPSKVIARLAHGISYTEGQHDVTAREGVARVVESSRLVVRHLTLPSRETLVAKQRHGLRRIEAGYSFDLGWQLQRLAHMTDAQLDAYWQNNCWHQAGEGTVLVGEYDRLAADDALVRIGRDLQESRRRGRPAGGLPRDQVSPIRGIASHGLDEIVGSLVDDLGRAALEVERLAGSDQRASQAAERLAALQMEFEERTAWALTMQRDLSIIRSSLLWRSLRALHLAPGSKGIAGP